MKGQSCRGKRRVEEPHELAEKPLRGVSVLQLCAVCDVVRAVSLWSESISFSNTNQEGTKREGRQKKKQGSVEGTKIKIRGQCYRFGEIKLSDVE